ncbi:MAG: serine/threonine protein kinase, partial [Planctomycetes bacterium]|nr:serine/threonine protein kinase [Planctomycetota bacterium]
RLELSFRQLRVLEYFFVIVEMAMFLWVQFSVNTHLIEQGDLMSVVALEKNGVMRTLIIMFTYAVFIPNTPRVTARVVLTMAACPIIILAIVLQYQPAGVNEMASTQNLGSNTIFVLIGAALSIFAAQTLNGLRYELSTARQLGQYRLLEKLGEGGMGAVYLAEHHLLKRPCALKLISPDLEDNSIAIARFEREVQSAAMLSHPNTIEIYDYGRADDGTFYYVMEYLPGLSVSDLVRQAGPLSPGRAIYLMRQVCGSLGEAHRMGLVHRDLKPANILVAILGGQCDVAKVLDFGLVKQTDPEAQGGPQLTADFTVSGTPSFMSPEQARGDRDVDGRADLYALGSILYFMLTGKPPFERENPLSLMIAHASEPVVPPTKLRPDVPADLEAVTLKCLAKSPADRYADARELSQALAACQNARDWDQTQAEQWWLEHAARQQPQAIETTSQHS